MKILLGAFGPYLNQRTNSSQRLLSRINTEDHQIKKIILPVSYKSSYFINPIKKYHPNYFILIGNWEGKHVKIESKAHNKFITVKNPITRFLVNLYAYFSWMFFKKNLLASKLPKKKSLTYLPIEKNGPSTVRLSVTKSIKKASVHAGYFVCNYAMYVISRFLSENDYKTRFYFIHIPLNPTIAQQNEIFSLIRKLIHSKN